LRLIDKLMVGGIFWVGWLALYVVVNNLDYSQRIKRTPAIGLDMAVPFVPEWIYFYLSTYVFVFLPVVFVSSAQWFNRVVLGYVFVTATCHLIYLAWPSSVQRADMINPHRLSERLIAGFQQTCRPYNNFPSMHMAYVVLCVCLAFRLQPIALGVALAAWAFLIALSTLLTKQHYIADIAGGLFVGAVAYSLVGAV